MTKIPVWMDCDTGTDDAVAIMLATYLEEIEVLGISTAAGNTIQENAYWNTHRINRLIGTNYPVYRGAEKPLIVPLVTGEHIHGANGLGDVEIPLPDDPVVQKESAWDALYACAKAHPHELRLVPTAPLTNIAIAFTKYPDLPGLLHSVNLMGGSAGAGNVTPAAEFNLYVDPQAADIVFRSGAKINMFGLDVTLQAGLSLEEVDELAASGKPAAVFTRDCLMHSWPVLSKFGETGFTMHDSCPVMYLAHPELFRGEEAGVVVETRGTITNGRTVTDLYSDKQFPFSNATVMLKLDREKFMKILKATSKDRGKKGYDPYFGYGIINYAKVYKYMKDPSSRPTHISSKPTKPKKAKITSLRGGRGKMKIRMRKLKKATSYQIAVKVKGGSFYILRMASRYGTIIGMRPGTKYYVKARGVRNVDGINRYGKWSKIKTVRIK